MYTRKDDWRFGCSGSSMAWAAEWYGRHEPVVDRWLHELEAVGTGAAAALSLTSRPRELEDFVAFSSDVDLYAPLCVFGSSTRAP